MKDYWKKYSKVGINPQSPANLFSKYFKEKDKREWRFCRLCNFTTLNGKAGFNCHFAFKHLHRDKRRKVRK
jgi:hypothetical protein